MFQTGYILLQVTALSLLLTYLSLKYYLSEPIILILLQILLSIALTVFYIQFRTILYLLNVIYNFIH